ncbi:Rab5-interacting protein-domain-containing protein [Astrocystis sublimbata]|nr:Rab5-interacting protein-domain-containing protein [Astrocystis sublimbata]
MPTEKEFQIAPIVPESVMHNTKASQLCRFPTSLPTHLPCYELTSVRLPQALSNLQNLTASIFGAAAGILGLESYSGFLFYFIFTLLTTALFYFIRVAPTSLKAGNAMFDTSRYYRSSFEFWSGGLLGGMAGYILTWTLFYGLVRA